jgi:glycerate 2-kinase
MTCASITRIREISGLVLPQPRALLQGGFEAALAAVKADAIMPALPPIAGAQRLLVLGAGKAAAAMAACVEAQLPERKLAGLAITRHGHGVNTQRIEVVEAGHPLPDAAGLLAAQRLLDLARDAHPDDQVLALLSGGGSSLLSLPATDIPLHDLQSLSRALLQSGAPIAEINCVRKHLSQTLGGRLAVACRAPVTVWLISDVTGDDPAVIASGPFAADPTTYADALDVLARRNIVAPDTIVQHLLAGTRGEIAETPKPGAACFNRIEHRLLANGRTALQAAAQYFASHGIRPVILGDTFSGEAREVAQAFAALCREIRQHENPWPTPVVLLSGGETSVTVGGGNGRGGRNSEFLLALAIALNGLDGVHALAVDSDGIDGSEDNAGALIAPDSLTRAAALGVDARAMLDAHDAYGFFTSLDDLVMTGPTRTNVNDIRVILIL